VPVAGRQSPSCEVQHVQSRNSFLSLDPVINFTSADFYMSRSPLWTHLVRFLAEEDGQIHLGQIDTNVCPDVGLALYKGERINATLVAGSVFDGSVTDKTMTISKVGFSYVAVYPQTRSTQLNPGLLLQNVASPSHRHVRGSYHPLSWPELLRRRQRSQSPHPRSARLVCPAADGTQWTVSSGNQRSQVRTGRIERL
jgi:hypothetical protein